MRIALWFVLFSLGCKGKGYDHQELEQAKKQALSLATPVEDIPQEVDESIQLFVDTFSRYQKEEMQQNLPKLYAKDAFLNDRIHSIQGGEAITQYFMGTFEKVEQAGFTIEDTSKSTNSAYIRWVMNLRLKDQEQTYSFGGVSHLMFDRTGKVIYHQDFWDFSELMKEFPVVGRLIQFVKSRA